MARAAREIVPLPSLVFWRWTFALVFLTVVAFPSLRLAWPAARPRLVELSIGGAIGVGLFSYLLLGGAYHSLALEVGFISATTPIWIVIIDLFGRRPRGAEDAVTLSLVVGLSCCRFDGHRDWVFHEAGGCHAETEVQPGV